MTPPPPSDPRVRVLSEAPVRPGRYVLYWMQQAQRAEDNAALEHATVRANELGVRLLVAFGLTPAYPEATLRAYRFMLEGLAETAATLGRRGVRLVVRLGEPDEVALDLARDAALVVCDRGYLRHQRAWRERVAAAADRRVEEVETDAVVPIDTASDRLETAARTLRPRIARHLPDVLGDLPATPLRLRGGLDDVGGVALGDPGRLAASLAVDGSVGSVSAHHEGGTSRAKRRLAGFIDRGLAGYASRRTNIALNAGANVSMYLHFGQLSPLYAATRVLRADAPEVDRQAFVEQAIVRRELCLNYVERESAYDRFDGVPPWARATLERHASDPRERLYDEQEIVEGRTHDRAFNAAMLEMRATGAMHNHMRMYWAKRILAWSTTPRHGFERTLRLNNRYFLDGLDAASFANVAWCYGLHDRPFPERPVFGTVRSMTLGGLRRKHDVDAYVRRVSEAVEG